MEKLVLHMGSRCFSAEELKKLVQKLSQKGKFKNEKVPWIELLKVLVNKLSKGHSDVLLQNILKLIKSQNHEPLKDGSVPKKEARTVLESLSDLITHIHHGLKELEPSGSDLSRVTAAILPVVIDMKVQLIRKEKSAAAEVIYNKLSSLLGHFPELLVDALLHCKTLIYSKLREPEIFVPIIKRVFSSLKASPSCLSPELFLKYLVLAKFLLFMTPKEELSQTRAQILGLLRLPSSFSEWISQNQIEWLQHDKLDTKTVLKNIIISTVLQTLYSKKGRAISPEKMKRETEGKSTLLSSQLKTTPVSENGAGSQAENEGSMCSPSEVDKTISNISGFENSRKYKRKICEDAGEMPSQTKKKKKKSKAKSAVIADLSVEEAQENGQWNKEIIPENFNNQKDTTEKQSSKEEGRNNVDEKVKTVNVLEAPDTEIPKCKLSNMEQSVEEDSDLKTHNVKKNKKKKKKKKKKTVSVMGDATEVSKYFSETETLKVEMIKESCKLASIGETESIKKTKRNSKDSLRSVDVSSITNAAGKEGNKGAADYKPSCIETSNDTGIENKIVDSQVISESLPSNGERKVKRKKKKKQKPHSDLEECLVNQKKLLGTSLLESSEVDMEDKIENHGSVKTSDIACKKKKKKLSQEVAESLPKKRKTESKQHSVDEREDSSETHLSKESATVGVETNILMKSKKRKIKEKSSNMSDKSKKLKEVMKKAEKVNMVGNEITIEKSAKVGVDKMKDKLGRKDKTRKKELPKEDLCIEEREVGGTEESVRNTKSVTCEGKKTKKKKHLKDVCDVECEVKLDQNSELRKKELMNLVKKSKISKKQFLRKMLDVVLGGSEGDDALKKSILVKLCNEVNDKKCIRKSKEVKDSKVEKLEEGKKKKKKKKRSELFVETSFEQSELARKKKLSLSIENLRDNSREKARRRRTCSLDFSISDLEPEKYRRVRNTVISAVSEPSSPTFESVNVERDVDSACDEISFTDNSEGGREWRVDVKPCGNRVGVGSEHAKAAVLTARRGNRKEGCPINKKTINTYSNELNANLKNTENQPVASSESDKKLRNLDNNTGNRKSLESEETRTMDKSTTEDSPSEVRDESSGIEIVFVGDIKKSSYDDEESDSERDEATGSDGDIVPCDEMNRMFTVAETKAYHQKVLEEGIKWKVHDAVIETSSVSKDYKDNCDEESKENSSAEENEDVKHVDGIGDEVEDSDANCNDSDIDVILETIVRDTGRESSVAGLKKELQRSRSSGSNDDSLVGVSSLTLSNGEGKEAFGTNDDSVLLDENDRNVGKAQPVDLNCQESPAVEKSCNKDEMTDIPVTDILREQRCLNAMTVELANGITPKLNEKCEEVSSFSKDKITYAKSVDISEKVCEESSESNEHLQSADKRVNSSGHKVLLTEDGELGRSKIAEETTEDNEHVMKHSSLTTCSRSPHQNGYESLSVTINGTDGDVAHCNGSLSSKKSEQCFDMEANMQTVSQLSSKSSSSLGDFLTAFEDLETSQTSEINGLSGPQMNIHNEVAIHSENEATNSLDSLLIVKVNGIESDPYKNKSSLESKNSERKNSDEPLVGRLLLSDESPVSEGASMKKAKAGDESFEVLSNEGDEAYEASSDASEEPLPVNRKRTRSQRKLVQASRFAEEVSDSDFSPMHRSLRSRRTSEGRKKNVCAKADEKLMNNSNACLGAKSGPESDSDDTSNMCNSIESSVTRQANSLVEEALLQTLVSNLETNDKMEKKDVATDKVKKPYLSDSELNRTKLSEKHAVDCNVGDKSSPDGLMNSQTCMGSQSAPEFAADSDNDIDGKSLHALESLASMHKLCEREKIPMSPSLKKTGVDPDVGGMFLDNFSMLETNECFNESFSSIEGAIQNMNEEEGDEIEVLSSGLDEDEEHSYNHSVENNLAADDCRDMGKGLRSTIRSRRLKKRSLINNTNSSNIGKKEEDFGDADIPQLKAQCVSEAVLAKEILISPEVSDEECELVSPEEDASRKKLPVPDNIIDTQGKISKGSISPFSLRGSRSGIRSPQKLIPEEQDESSPRRLKHSPSSKESPCQKSAKFSRRSSSSERGTVARTSSSNSPKSVASKKTDATKLTPHKNGDAMQSRNISPKKSAFSKYTSKEEKSLKPKSNSSASETDPDGALKLTESTLDKGGKTSLLLRSGSGKSNLDSGAKLSGSLTESDDSLLSKTGECNELIGAEVLSVKRKMNEENTVVNDSCDKNVCSSETDDSVSDTKSKNDSMRSFPSHITSVRRSSRLSLSKVALKGKTQSKALSSNKQTSLQEGSDSELPVSPRKSKGMGNQGKAELPSPEKSLKEENQLSSSPGSPTEQVDLSSPTTPKKSQMKDQGSASPSAVEKPSEMERASPSRGRPKKNVDTSPLTPRKTGMQGNLLPLTPINTRKRKLVSPVLGIKKDGSPLTCSGKEPGSKKISSPSVLLQKSLQDPKAADVSEADSARLSGSRSSSSSPRRMSCLKVPGNAVLKLDRVRVGLDSANSESDSGERTACSNDSRALPNILQTTRVSTRGKTLVVRTSPSPKKLVKDLRVLSPALQTKKTDQRSSAIKGKASVSLQESVEDEVNVSTRRLRHREVTYTTKR